MKRFKKITAMALVCALLMSMPALGASADTEPVASVNEPTLISEEQQEQNYA